MTARTASVLLIALTACRGAATEPRMTDMQIVLIPPPQPCVLGLPMPAKVIYRNASSAPVTLSDPARTWEVAVEVRRAAAEPDVLNLGRYRRITTSGGVEKLVREEAEELEIPGGGEHVFTVDLGARWPDVFEPGSMTLRVIDRRSDSRTLESESVGIGVRFTKESVLPLLETVANSEVDPSHREWAAGWLGRLNPSLVLSVPAREDAAGVRAAKEDQLRESAARYRNWWSAARDSADVAGRIATLNADAGPR